MKNIRKKILNAFKPITKPTKNWYKALTNSLMISVLGVLAVVRGYIITSYNRRNIGRRFKTLFLAAFDGNHQRMNYGLTEETCNHLKGGRNRAPMKDYNVLGHTFSDGTSKIWCANGCGFKSFKGDQNWQTAMYMMDNSSNHPSSSERMIRNKDVARAAITVVCADRPE